MTYTDRLTARKVELETAMGSSTFREWIIEYAAVLQALGVAGSGGGSTPGDGTSSAAQWTPVLLSTTRITGAVGGAGYETTGNVFVVPVSKEWQLVGGCAIWRCSSSNLANRSLTISIVGASSEVLFSLVASSGELASSTNARYNFGVTQNSVKTTGSDVYAGISIPPLILKAGEKITIGQNNAQEGDEFELAIRVVERSV